jgi:DNA-directed RNA polymerase subunit H (RpoH/RPB5)
VKSGDIVKITRNAVFGGTYYYYRVVEWYLWTSLSLC